MIAAHQAATAESRTLPEIVSPPSNAGVAGIRFRFSIIVCYRWFGPPVYIP